jgi:O-methyltransferase involved in polyketide biosynthesis
MNLQPDKIHKVHLAKEKETLLITLYAKALDSYTPKPILHDQKAAELVATINYDFEKLSFGNGNIMVIRAKQLDTWLQEFLKTYPEASVLNLGCGLDTRISRIDPQTNVNWFDVDYPEVIDVRKLFYANRPGYTMISSSVTEFGWLETIPNNKPVMILAEGLLEYLTQAEVKTLLSRLTGYFPQGRIAFDVMNSFAITSGKENLKETTGAEHKWAVNDLHAVDRLNNKLERIAGLSVFKSRYVRNLPLKYRLIYATMSAVPAFRDMIRLLLYRF